MQLRGEIELINDAIKTVYSLFCNIVFDYHSLDMNKISLYIKLCSGFRIFALFSIHRIIKNSKKSKTLIILIILIVWLIFGLGGVGGWTLTFVDVGCMYIISINQRIKRIRIFIFLIFWLIKKLSIHHTSTEIV